MFVAAERVMQLDLSLHTFKLIDRLKIASRVG
jgi:hypothetical protein